MIAAEVLPRKSRLAALLDHFADVEVPRDVRRILHPLPEVLLLVVCGTIADCDDYEDIAGWGAAHLDFLRRHLPYEHGVPGERWLTILMNRINPGLFAAWVRESWPEKAGLVAIDGKTSRRSHDRGAGVEPLHLVSAFATTARLVLARGRRRRTREASSPPSPSSSSASAPTTAAGRARLHRRRRHQRRGRPRHRRPGRRLAARGQGQPADAARRGRGRLRRSRRPAGGPPRPRQGPRPHRGTPHRRPPRGRLARRRPPLPGRAAPAGHACLVRAETRVEAKGAVRTQTRYFISSRALTAAAAAAAIREHWAIENRLHWVLDVTFADDQSRLRKGHGARNMATVRHFALNLVRAASDKRSIKSRRKSAGWDPAHLDAILASRPE